MPTKKFSAEGPVTSMNVETYIPSPALRPYTRQYIIVKSPDGMTNHLLPGTAFTMAFRLKGNAVIHEEGLENKIYSPVISGLRKSVKDVTYGRNTAMLIVLFKAAGASAFIKEPLQELYGKNISLDYIFKQRNVEFIEDQLANAATNHEKIAVLEQFLFASLHNAETDKLVAAAIEKIELANGILKIKELANSLYISQDAFEKRFRKKVGATPKQYASIVRMNAIIKNLQPGKSLTDIVFDAGYYDQSHFNKEFKTFTGRSPMSFFNAPFTW